MVTLQEKVDYLITKYPGSKRDKYFGSLLNSLINNREISEKEGIKILNIYDKSPCSSLRLNDLSNVENTHILVINLLYELLKRAERLDNRGF